MTDSIHSYLTITKSAIRKLHSLEDALEVEAMPRYITITGDKDYPACHGRARTRITDFIYVEVSVWEKDLSTGN